MTGFFKRLFVNIPLLFFFLLPPIHVLPQSIDKNNPELGFVVFSKNSFYGLNLDNSVGEIRFRIETQNQHRVFFVDQFKNETYQTIAAINDQGTFVSYFLFDDQSSKISPTIFYESFNSLLFDQISFPLPESNQLSSNSLIINNSSQLFADENLKGFIIQTKNGESEFYQNQKYLINSAMEFNSLSSDSSDDFFHPVQQIKRVEEEINKRLSEFSIQDGFLVLEKAQPNQNMIASIIFDPENNLIYLAFDKDFNKIWLINLDGETIETFSGFERYHKGNIPKIGITANDLRILNFSNEGLMVRIIIGAIGILFIILISIFVSFRAKKVIH